MANPRKFSEKIALLNQKEAEGTAEFERIMREVSEVSSKDNEPPTTLAGLLTTSGYSNDITNNTNSSDGKSSSRESRGRSVGGGPMRSRSRNIDTSPYSSTNTAYLSPPDNTWRRTSSDSAIHQSLGQSAQDLHNNPLMLSPRAHKRLSSSQSNSMKNLHLEQHHQSPGMSSHHSHSQQNIPQSPFNQQSLIHQHQSNQQHLTMSNLQQDMKSRSVSRLPGINVYPSHNEDTLQIPVGNSTGSLPDLTLVHYQQSPLSNPLDLEHDQLIAVSSSSYTNSSYSMPMAMSTNESSSTQLPSMAQHHLYQMGQQQQVASNNLENFSPKHVNNSSNNTNGNSTNNNKISSSSQGGQMQGNNPIYTQPSSPIPIDSHHQRHQHHQHSPLHHQSYPNNQITTEKMMSYRNANAASPANLSSSQGNLSKNSYRNSPHNRPSPGSSPSNVPGLSANFDSNSSAPCSPSPITAGNNGQFDALALDGFYMNPSIQQHFEQFSLDWTSLVQSLVDSGCTISAEVKVDQPSYDITPSNDQNYSQMNDNYNGMMNDSPNRQSPTNHSNAPSRTNARTSNSSNHMNHQTTSNNHQTNNGNGSPHSPLSNDSILSGGNYDGMSCDNLRNNINLGSPGFDGVLLNGTGSGNGVNDIMLGGGLGSDSSSKLITSSSAALQTSLMTSHTSPMHLNTNTTSSIPEIVFSDYSSSSEFREFLADNFLDSSELQMFDNNIIDPTIEDSFRRDLC